MRQSKRLVAISIAFAVAFAVALLPALASAETVAVLATKAPLRAKLTRALKQQKIRVVPGAKVGKALRNASVPLSDADWARVAGKLGLDAFVIAKPASDGGSDAQLEVVIRSGSDGSIANQETISTKARPKQVGELLASALSKRSTVLTEKIMPPMADRPAENALSMGGSSTSTLEPAKPPAPASTASAAAPTATTPTEPPAMAATSASSGGGDEHRARKPSNADESTTLVGEGTAGGDLFEGATGKLAAIDIEAEGRELRRTFDYNGGAAPRYRLTFNPAVGARASYFPIRNAGVFAAGEFSSGLETSGFPTGTREVMGGLQGRLPIPLGQIRVSAAYFHHAFLVQDTSSTSDPSRLTLGVPNTVYQGGRASVSARITLAPRVQLGLEAAYRLVTNLGSGAGEVRSAAYFPGASKPYGLDGRAMVSFALTKMFEARAGFDYRRYGYGKLQGTTAGGTMINASSATDQYMAFSLGLAAVLGPQ